MTTTRYLRPGRPSTLLNSVVTALARRGISLWGSRLLLVPGRASGQWRSTPVNPLRLDGDWYLVAPRGETQWVRNLRAAGHGKLHIGRRSRSFTATELPDPDKPEVLRTYLRRWRFEVGTFFTDVDLNSTDEQFEQAGGNYPVFLLDLSDA